MAVVTNPAEVVSLLSRQRDLCQQLAGLANGQRALITSDNPERLLEVLADRQTLLDEMTAVGRQLQPYQQNWREVRGQLSSEDGRRADGLVAEVNTLLQTILQNDEADGQLLSARKESTGSAAVQFSQGRQAGTAYAAAGSGGDSRDWMEA